MARRKRKDEEPDWVAPEFDEIGYMRQEIEGARAAVATIAWAVVGAIVAFLLYAVLPVLAFFAGIAVGFGLYFVLPLLGINTESFKRRDWTGHGVTYFFSWLAFWIILLNPPFGDFTDPTIQGLSVSPFYAAYTGDLRCFPTSGETVTLSMGPLNDSIYVLFRATDNVGLSAVNATVTPAGFGPQPLTPNPPPGDNRCAGHRNEPYPAGTYYVTFPSGPSSFIVRISVVDGVGRQAGVSFSITTVP